MAILQEKWKMKWVFPLLVLAKYIDAFLKSDVRACADNESVRLADFGTFTVRVMAERKGRKPQTGEIMNLPSRRAVRFIPASDFDRKLKGK